MKLYTDFSVSVGQKLVTDYISFIWTDRYNECGDFEMVVPYNSSNSRFYHHEMVVTCSKSNRRMIIEKIQISLSPENGSVMKISGRSYESVLDRRVVSIPLIITNDTYSENKFITGLNTIVQSCCGNNNAVSQFLSSKEDTLDPKLYSNYKVEPSRSLGIKGVTASDSIITSSNINIDATGKTLLEILEELCQSKDFGFSYNGGSSINIYYGRSGGTSYSFLNGNLSSADYISDKTNYKNAMYIQGEEYTSPGDIVNVNGIEYSLKELEEKGLVAIITPDLDDKNPIYYRAYTATSPYLSGLDRREMYYSSNKSKGKNSDHKYAARLRADGAYELFKHGFKVQAAVQIVNDDRSNVQVGDLVNVNTGLTILSMRVSERTISHSESGLFIYPVLTGYDPNKTSLSNLFDSGYDPTEHSDEISEAGYDKSIEVDFLFNGGKIEYTSVMYVEPGNGQQSSSNAQYDGWYILPKSEISAGSFVTVSKITGLYNYQEIGDFLTLPNVNIEYEHHTFVKWVKNITEEEMDETHIISKDDPNPLVMIAKWKSDIHYVVCDPGEYGSYSSGMATKFGSESYFQEWIEENENSDEPKFFSWYVTTGSYEGCIVKLYKYGEYPRLPTPNYPSSRTFVNEDGSTTIVTIKFVGWDPSPVTKVEEREKRYTAQYEVTTKMGDPPPDPPIDPDLPYSNEVEDEPVEMLHFESRGTNKGCGFSSSPSHPDTLVKTSAGGYNRQQYQYAFEAELLNRNSPASNPIKTKITYQVHVFSGRGEVIKESDDLVTKTWKRWASFAPGVSFIIGDKAIAFTLLVITDMPKVPELAISKKPYVFPNYSNVSLSNQSSLIPFMPYAYGSKDGDIYQRPPSNWKTGWKSYYRVNAKSGVKVGFCVNYYDAFGNRIDEEWSANGGTRSEQPNLAKKIEIDGKTYFVDYPVTYGTYYVDDEAKHGPNSIYYPYCRMTNLIASTFINGDASRYWSFSGWRFFSIVYSDEGIPINDFTSLYECGKTLWEWDDWLIGKASCVFGSGFPTLSGSYEIAARHNRPNDYATVYGPAPGSSVPTYTTADPIDKLTGDGRYGVVTIMSTRNCICSPDGRAMFVYYGIIPGHELKYKWQVYTSYSDGGNPEWLDIPDCEGTRLFVECTDKSVGELWQLGYSGIYAVLGTHNSEYRCVVSYTTKIMQEDGSYKDENVEVVAMSGKLIIDSSAIPTGIVIDDNPDLSEDDRPDKIKDRILENMKTGDISDDTKSNMKNTVQSINGDSKPEKGSSNYNYTVSSLKQNYGVSGPTADSIIDSTY